MVVEFFETTQLWVGKWGALTLTELESLNLHGSRRAPPVPGRLPRRFSFRE